MALAACASDEPEAVAESGVWSVAEPADVGVEPQRLRRLASSLDRDYPGVSGILVARHGRIAFERYRNGTTAATKFPIYSITKTVLSMLVGVAVGAGDIANMDSLLGDVLPESVVAAEDQRVQEVTFRQMMTMTAGWKDEPVSGKNMLLKAINRRLARDPGERWAYDNGTAHIISAAVARATGFTTREYARQAIFQPLAIAPGKWPTDAEGIHLGSTGLELSVRDLAKLGELYLREGEWEGERLIHRRWIQASTKDWVSTDDPRYGFGYFWWVHRPTKSYAGFGFGGQVLWVAPAQDVVVAITADPRREPRVQELITELVLPAVSD